MVTNIAAAGTQTLSFKKQINWSCGVSHSLCAQVDSYTC